MTLWDELYFEITVHGAKSELEKFKCFLQSGDLDDFFEVLPEYVITEDDFDDMEESKETELVFSNDDYGIEIEEFDTDEFLEVFCRAGRKFDIYGTLCDSDGTEFNFMSSAGDSYYINSRKDMIFNDELDAVAMDEDAMDEEDGYMSM